MNTTYATQNNVGEELKKLFEESGIENLSQEMKDYIMGELGDQVIERVMIQIVKELPESKVTAFLEFIEKGASQESLYIYLTSIYPKAGDVIVKVAREILEEFKQGLV